MTDIAEKVEAALSAWFATSAKGWNRAMLAALEAALPASDVELLALARARRCSSCDGAGWVPNPDAQYTMDYVEHMPTGYYSTNDEEEIECPKCDGVGFLKPRPPAPSVMSFAAVDLDEDLPF